MDRGIEVFVTILEEKVSSLTELSRGAAMAAALERLAQGGGLQEIEDPLLWERDVRGDRPLPGREP